MEAVEVGDQLARFEMGRHEIWVRSLPSSALSALFATLANMVPAGPLVPFLNL